MGGHHLPGAQAGSPAAAGGVRPARPAPTGGYRPVAGPLSIAPMMGLTDRHYRRFMRGITRHALLYTEMITTPAVLHGDRGRLLGYDPQEHPLALQLGGDDPAALAESARIAEGLGYDEVNLNVGCPSDRVKSGNFGACLMARPEAVARAVEAMRAAVSIPVTVKHRIGIDHRDSYEELVAFVRTVAAAGCDRFTVHARKAWLQGLSPKENRTIPPLRYDYVYRLKREHPELPIEINGGIRDLAEAREQLRHVDAVMIGRAAYEDPYRLATADALLYGADQPATTRREALESFLPYVEEQLARGAPLKTMARHLLNLTIGQPGARAWRRHLSERAHRPGSGTEVLLEAMALVPDRVWDERPAVDALPLGADG